MKQPDPADASRPPTERGVLADLLPPGKWLIVLAAWVLLLHVGSVAGRWMPTPDSALYLGLGRSIARGAGYRFNGEICTSVAPGLPLALAGIRIALTEAPWAPNLLMALCGLAAAALCCAVITRMDGRATAVVVAAIWALSYTFYDNAHRVLTDMPFAMLFWAMLYAVVRFIEGSNWSLLAAGMLSTAATVVRLPGVLIICPAALGVGLAGWSRASLRRRLLAGSVVGLCALVSTGLFLAWACSVSSQMPLYGKFAAWAVKTSFPQRLAELGRAGLHLTNAASLLLTSQRGQFFIQLAALLLVLAVVGLVSLWRRGRRLPAAVLLLYPLALAGAAGGAHLIRERYFLPVQPFLIYAITEGLRVCIRMVCRLRARSPHRAVRTGVIIFAVALIAANTPRTVRDAFYNAYFGRTDRYYEVVRHGRHREVVKLAETICRDCPPQTRVVLANERPRMLHFLTDRVVVPLGDTPQRTASDARKLLEDIRRRRDPGCLVFNVREAGEPFRGELAAEMSRAEDFRQIHCSGSYLAYARRDRQGVQSRPASSHSAEVGPASERR